MTTHQSDFAVQRGAERAIVDALAAGTYSGEVRHAHPRQSDA